VKPFGRKIREFYSVFISYSSKDTAVAERLHADLRASGVPCYFDKEDMKIGEKIRIGIDRAIRSRDKLLLLISSNSLSSNWVENEVEIAFERERREQRVILFPVTLDDAISHVEEGWAATIRRTRHIGDFRNWEKS